MLDMRSLKFLPILDGRHDNSPTYSRSLSEGSINTHFLLLGLTHSVCKNKGLGLLFPYGNATLT